MKLPILFRPIAIAFAIGVSVSVAQYLATLFAGGGRVPTLTTEALALASGGDRRVAAIAGFLQALLPMAVYLAALMAPRLVVREPPPNAVAMTAHTLEVDIVAIAIGARALMRDLSFCVEPGRATRSWGRAGQASRRCSPISAAISTRRFPPAAG